MTRCRRLAAFALVFALGVALSAARPKAARAADTSAKPKVKLAVLVVFDQMRGDYLDKWKPLFGTDGFARLQTDGAWFKNCHYPYGTTTTGPGHASMLTGTCGDKHGIINNNWYDTASGEDVYCAGSLRYQFVPPPKPATATTKPKPVGNPDNLLSEGVADVLKRVTNGKGKVFGLSLKDRSAIFPTGKRPDGAYWFDGRFHTSTYYADRVHPWVEAFNASRAADRWFGRDWTKFRPDLDYDKYTGPDKAAGEGAGTKQGTTFPHLMTGGAATPGSGYYTALANSPFGNELLLELAKTCVVEEKLGQDEVPDLLTVSFSSNDLIGHTWGPDSHEVLDVTLRSDALMADFLKFLDVTVGKGSYVMAVTADHGVCSNPEFSAAHGKDAKRVSSAGLLLGAEKHMRATFGTFAGPEEKDAKADDKDGGDAIKKNRSLWIEAVSPPWLYLNKRFVAMSGKPRAQVANSLAEHLRKQPDIFRVYTREQLTGEIPADDAVGRLVKRSFYPDRSGDVYVVLKPYYLFGTLTATGTTHGAPHEYDRHVPLLVYGPGVAGGAKTEAVTPQATAAVFAKFLGVPAPKDADFPVPASLEAK